MLFLRDGFAVIAAAAAAVGAAAVGAAAVVVGPAAAVDAELNF